MNTSTLIEIFGYIGSVLVVVSMLMSSIVKLRIINTIGSVISATYAFISGALPLVLMNICLIIINIISLYKLLKNKKTYELMETEVNESFIQYFMERYGNDIKLHFPEFEKAAIENKKAYVVFCDGNAAGLTIVKETGNEVELIIDYSTPAYRDCSVGQYLYECLAEKNIKALKYCSPASETHAPYLAKMGFVQKNGIYEKSL